MSEIKPGLGLYRHTLIGEYFAFTKQCGCTHLIIHLADCYSKQIVTATSDSTNYELIKGGEDIWSAEYMTGLQKMAGRYGLCIYGIENFNPADWYSILLGGPGWQEQMEVLEQIIRNAEKTGIHLLGYNFNLADVQGHQKHPHTRGGAMGTCLDSPEIKYDVPTLREQIWNMACAEGDGICLEPISSLQLWDRLKWLLEEIPSVTEEVEVEMALHPDGPPMGLLHGTSRLVFRPGLYQRVIDISSNKSNKLELCLDSTQEVTHGSIYDVIEQCGDQEGISYVHFRNIKGKVPKYDKVFMDEGNIDTPWALTLLEAHNFDGVVIPDHTSEILCNAPRHAGVAFALGYMRSTPQMTSRGLLKEVLEQGGGSYEG